MSSPSPTTPPPSAGQVMNDYMVLLPRQTDPSQQYTAPIQQLENEASQPKATTQTTPAPYSEVPKDYMPLLSRQKNQPEQYSALTQQPGNETQQPGNGTQQQSETQSTDKRDEVMEMLSNQFTEDQLENLLGMLKKMKASGSGRGQSQGGGDREGEVVHSLKKQDLGYLVSKTADQLTDSL